MNDPNFERRELAKNLRQISDQIEGFVEREDQDPRQLLGYASVINVIANALASSASRQIGELLCEKYDKINWDDILRNLGDSDARY